MEYIGTALSEVWRLFSVPWPGVGLSCAQVILGIFVVSVSIGILKSLLDLAGIITNSAVSGAHGFVQKGRYKAKSAYSHAKKVKAARYKKDE